MTDLTLSKEGSLMIRFSPGIKLLSYREHLPPHTQGAGSIQEA